MGVFGGPNVSEDGLVLALDGANFKSFKGEVTTNLIPNPTEEMPRGEFGQYRDLASIFDTNGLTAYSLSMDIKTNIPGNVYVYMQNGSYTKYGFVSSNAYCTTEYQRFYFNNLTPVLSSTWQQNTPNDNRAVLATYTGYGSGINPTVKDIQLEQRSYSTKFVSGTRGATVATGGGWADLIGNGNNGELVNGVRESSDNLGSLVFDGTNDYVLLTRNDFNTSLPNFTISVFVYKISDGIILGNHRHNQTWESVWLSTTEFTVNDANGTANRQTLYHTTPINSWMNLVAVNNSSQNYMKVFLNGAEIATKTATVIPWNSSIIPTIGANLLGGDLSPVGPINGRISNTQIYNRALSAAEVSQNFNALRGRYGI